MYGKGFDPKYNQVIVNEILREGFYINEALNHLTYYFKNKIPNDNIILHRNTSETYDVNNYYVNPAGEYKIDGKFKKYNSKTKSYELKNNIEIENNALMIPILQFLDTGLNTAATKPTKFITIVCVKNQASTCLETMKSLEFAQSISSTV